MNRAKWTGNWSNRACGLLAAVCATVGMEAASAMFYVAQDGNDAWSGTLEAPNANRTDGPFRTLSRAQQAVRSTAPGEERRVIVRAGEYYLSTPLVFGPEDSGTPSRPVVYEAYANEHPTISGGRPITGWQERGNGVWAAPVPEAKSGKWEFRQLRVGDDMQILARYPNYDPAEPTKGGWLFARQNGDKKGSWQITVANIHTPGDWMEWNIDVPADGAYNLWMYYGQLMKKHGRDNMDGQTVFQVDGGEDIPLMNLPDTGAWGTFKWSRCATLPLTKGKHTLRWTNRKGGGINFNAFALCTDAGWTPSDTDLAEPAPGEHLIVRQAETYDKGEGREMKVTESEFRGKRDELPFGPGDIPDWDLSGGQILVFPAWGWVGGPVQIGGVDRDKHILKLTGQNAQQDIRLGNRYCIQNVRGALDQPGEFYLDRDAGELLYIPADPNFTQKPVVAPVLDRLIEIQGDADTDAWAEHIQFRGLAFRDARYSIAVDSLYAPDDAAIRIDRARNILVDNCAFSHLGGYAVRLANRAQKCWIVGSTMHTMGQGGVIARGTTADQPVDCTVAGCSIYDLGLVYKHVAGVYVTTGSGFRIAHCDIHDVPRYAISFKSYNKDSYSHNNIAEYNDLRRTNLETNDTGAIETLGRDRALSGNVIRYNLILDVIGMKHTSTGGIVSPFYTWGIYLDDYSSGTHIYGNIVARTYRGSYHNHLGFDNTVENNVFIDGYLYQAEWNGRDDMRRNTFTHNIVSYSNPDAVYIRSSGWSPEVLRACDNNVIWWTGGDLTSADKSVTPAGTWANWQALGFDTHSRIADPRFVDAASDDYRLRPDSPALELGFKPIPVDRIGVKGYIAED